MIKVNLVGKEKRERKGLAIDLKAIKVQDLFKGRPEYFAGILSWLLLGGVAVYYLSLSSRLDTAKRQVEDLRLQKSQLQAKAKEFIDKKKALEEEISRLRGEIEGIERSKDIIVSLKAQYEPFNKTLDIYLNNLPKVSWVSNYRQSFDTSTGLIKSEFEVNSLDYTSASNYGQRLSSFSKEVQVSSVERKLNPNGIEYYTLKLTAVREAEGR